MHFAKTYTQLLLNLPPELRDSAVQYRQLKKLINQVVLELTNLGLNPDILKDLLAGNSVVYEFSANGPQLRISSSDTETIVPLKSDSAFFQLLGTTLTSLDEHLESIQADFTGSLVELSRKISSSARPAHIDNQSFKPVGLMKHPGTISLSSTHNKSDLYSWRELFQLYLEAQVFESISETHRGERPVEESEQRLTLFVDRVRGRAGELKLQQSREALETFLEINLFILNLRKFQDANSEATRKILKKHTKRTALPLPPQSQALVPSRAALPRMLVQSMTETLLPIIPHIDDYSCLICTGIAFKPIRLACGHLFCVRCLVKMQKRGQGDCPMCRARTVLVADRSNVDYALLNFLQDWFPEESKAKLKQNEKEANEERMIELGLNPEQKCLIM